MIKIGGAIVLTCLCLIVPQVGIADPVVGELGISGIFQTTGGSGPLDLAGATGIDFTGALVTGATGDFLSNGVVPVFSQVIANDFTFAPSSAFTPVDPLWTVWSWNHANSFQFALEELTSVSQGTDYLNLTGTGTLTSSVSGLDATPLSWQFSGHYVDLRSLGGLLVFSNDGATSPIAVAEPSELVTLALWPIGIVAFGVWSRKRRMANVRAT